MNRLILKPAPSTPSPLRLWFTPLLAVVIFTLDQLSKTIVSANLPLGKSWMPIDVVGAWLRVTHVQNSGAAFGMFRDGGMFFLIVAVVVVLGIVRYYLTNLHTAPSWMRVALGLMLGGALGNLVDRIRFGYVVDFIDFGYRANWWPVFNVADSSVFIGVTLLAIYMSFVQPQDGQPAPATSMEPVERSAPPTT